MQLLFKFLARALVAVIGLSVFLGIGYVGGWLFCAAVAGMTLLALHEYYSALRLKQIRPNAKLGWLCGLLLLAIAQHGENMRRTLVRDGQAALGGADLNVVTGTLHLTLLVLLFCVAGTLVCQFRLRPGESALVNSATTVFGVVYIGLLFSFLLRMRYVDVPGLMEPNGLVPALVRYPWGAELWRRMGGLIFVIGPVWLGDTGAFLVGNLWGRRKLAPRISPGKTVEGSIAGLVAAVGGALLAGWWLGMGLLPSGLLGVMMGVVGQLGDLGKSVLKRDLGIKDFGEIFGPHGGVLDRFDAILFSLPLVYWYFWFLVMKVGTG
jgi:phosphatidate cytidylyltransferase